MFHKLGPKPDSQRRGLGVAASRSSSPHGSDTDDGDGGQEAEVYELHRIISSGTVNPQTLSPKWQTTKLGFVRL